MKNSAKKYLYTYRCTCMYVYTRGVQPSWLAVGRTHTHCWPNRPTTFFYGNIPLPSFYLLLLKFYVNVKMYTHTYTHTSHVLAWHAPLLSRQSLSKCFLFVFGFGKDRPFLCLPVLILIVPGLILSIN